MMREHKKASKQYENGGKGADPGPEPERPARLLCVIEDASTEALQDALAENGGACLLARDELAAVFKAFGKHGNAKGGGGDGEALCQCWNGGSWAVNRIGREGKYVQRACLSMAGGMTTDNASMLFPSLSPTGLAARLLMIASPLLPPLRWDDGRPDPVGAADYERVWLALHALKPAQNDDGSVDPYSLWLDKAANKAFADAQFRYKSLHAQSAHDEPVAALVGKMDAHLLRIAGVLHLVRMVDGDAVQSSQIDAQTMGNAVRIADWLLSENLRIYDRLRAGVQRLRWEGLARLIEGKGGTITPAVLQRDSRNYASAEDAKAELVAMADAGYGVLDYPAPGSQGGAPKDGEFRLHPKRRTPRETLETGVS
jgi:hypothetical protein